MPYGESTIQHAEEGLSDPVCARPGCLRRVKANGLCGSHYQAWRLSRPSTPRCSIAGCAGPVYAKALCRAHWRRVRKYGDPLGFSVPPTRPAAERFWEKVDKNGPIPAHRPDLGPCHSWLGAKGKRGYGKFAAKPRVVDAYVFAYELVVGPVPEGTELDHLCRNHGCVNTDHLEPVTHHENTMRGDSPSAVNARKTECIRGHPFDIFTINAANGRPRRACSKCRALRSNGGRVRVGLKATSPVCTP